MKMKEFRQTLAEAFIKSLEENPRDWKQEWSAMTNRPYNAVTNKEYKGINRLALQYIAKVKGYDDPRWCTFKQIQSKDWHLIKGSKGENIEYWMPYDTLEKKALTWNEYREIKDTSNIKLIAKYSIVFNAAQIEGIPELVKVENDINPAEIINKISRNMGVEIINDGGNDAFYRKAEDTIHLPKANVFDSDYAYNATALHELSHATGHASRLNRFLDGGFGSSYYAYEELVAELSACFMSEHLPTTMNEEHFENHKAYIQGWIEGIKEKPEVFVKAAKDAEKAANLLEYEGELISQLEYKKRAESAYEVDKKQVCTQEELPKEIERVQLIEKSQKGYVKEYITRFIENYDFNNPVKVTGRTLPSLIIAEEIENGGMRETNEECLDWINQDPEAAFNTEWDMPYIFPQLKGLTAEKNPRQFSLVMMERELYKMLDDTPSIPFDREITFDKQSAMQLCEKNGIKVPENARYTKMRVPNIELE